MAEASPACSSCGAPLSTGAIQGLCLDCLLQELPPTPLSERSPLPAAPPPPVFPRPFGPFTLLEEIGRGGMGIVYRAHQPSLNRIVAVKVLLLGDFAGVEYRERFRAEAQAAARLHHPNIVPVYEIGSAAGEWFFSMEFVPGQSLAQLLRQTPLAPRTAALYLSKIARAIHAAHEQGIVHRDLKPSNILIDAHNEPRVTDFGLAKDLHAHSDLTHTGQILGSPSYMPPEQAAGRTEAVGVRSDVYSLGAVLFAMLTGHPPFQAHSPPATLRLVLESAVPPLRRFNPSIPPDLETLCLKCLEKQPHQRYASALDLAEELDRFLAHRPILARPVGPVGKLWRWSHRHPLAASLAAALFAVSALGAIGVLTQWQRARASERRARAELYAADMTLAHEALARNEFARARAILDRHPPPNSNAAPRRWEWNHLAGQTHGNDLAHTATGLTPILDLSVNQTPPSAGPSPSPSSPSGFEITLFSPDHRLQTFTFDGKLSPANNSLSTNEWRAWKAVEGGWAGIDSQGNLQIAAPNSAQTATIRLPDLQRSPATSLWPIWTLNQTLVATRDSLLWMDHKTGVQVRRVNADDPRFIAASNHDTLFVGDRLGVLRIYSLATGRSIAAIPAHSRRIEALACSPDGARLISAAPDEVRVWDVARRAQLAVLPHHSGPVLCAAFSPDGQQFVTAGSDRVPRVWSSATLQALHLYRGPTTGIRSIGFSPDGAFLIAGDGGGTLWTWPVPPPPDPPADHTFPPQSLGHSVAPDGSALATLHANGSVHLFDVAHRRPAGNFPAPLRDVFCGATAPGAALLAAGTTQGALQIRQITQSNLVALAETRWPGQRVWVIAFSPNASRIAAATEFGSLRLLETQTLRELQSWPIAGRARGPLLFSNQGEWIAFASNENRAGQLLLAQTRPNGAFRQTRVDPAEGFAFSPDDRWFASAHGDGTLRLEHLASGRVRAVANSQAQRLTAVTFSPDGARIIAGASDGSLVIWSSDDLEEVGCFRRQTRAITDLFFVAQTDTLVSVTHDGLRYWSGASAALPVGTLATPPAPTRR